MLTNTYLTFKELPLIDRAILEVVRLNPGMTRNEVEEALGVHKGTYRMRFPPLIKYGFLVIDGVREGGRAEELVAMPLEMLD